MDRETERPRGFAFITLASQGEVDRAIGQLNDTMYVAFPSLWCGGRTDSTCFSSVPESTGDKCR